MKRAEEPML